MDSLRGAVAGVVQGAVESRADLSAIEAGDALGTEAGSRVRDALDPGLLPASDR